MPYGRIVGSLLLIGDSPSDGGLIRKLLEGLPGNRTIECVETLAAGLARVAAGGVGVVLLDLCLPDAQGVDCVTAVRRQRTEPPPIVVLTAVEDDEVALRCLAAGAQDYIGKQSATAQSLRRAIAHAAVRCAEAAQRRRADAVQAQLAAIVEASSDAIVSTTLDGMITSWNRGARELLGHTAAEAIGRPWHEVARAPLGASPHPHHDRVVIAAASDRAHTEEVTRLRRDGSEIVLSVVSCAVRDAAGDVVAVAMICRDVTELKRRDVELRRNHEALVRHDVQMRALARRLDAVREDERTRLSRSIHDELGQALTGLKMDLRWVARKLAADTLTSPQLIVARLADAERLIDRSVATVQRLAVELRPASLDTLGLRAAIRDEGRRFEARSGVIAEVDVHCEVEPTAEVATGLFRIYQELLTNVARHAHASRVRVELLDDDGWTLRVEDDGVGVSLEPEPRATSLGLLGMRERVEALGGAIALERGPERGTIAKVHVPRAADPEGSHAARPDRG